MSTWRILITVLLLIHPALSQYIKTTCEIPSVEAGENATLTIHFDQDLSQEKGPRDFSLERIGHSLTASQTKLLNCEFSYGNVTCKNTPCCTWESHVTDVFRVYIHSVSQELEGRFWGFVIPADLGYQKSCNFSLKAYTCHTDTIIATNSHVICNKQTVAIGETCNVTCSPGHHFQENQTSVTYTCVGKNKWSPEISVTSCEEQSVSQKNIIILLSVIIPVSIIGIGIGIVFLFRKRLKEWIRNTNKKDENDIRIPFMNGLEREINNSPTNPLLYIRSVDKKGATKYWLGCIQKWYPELQSRTHFLPPFHFNSVQYRQKNIAECMVQMPHNSQNTDVCADRAIERVLQSLYTLADNSPQTDNPQQTDNSPEIDNPQQTDNSQESDNPQQTDNSQVINNPQQICNSQQTDNPQQSYKPQQTDYSEQKEVMMVISQLQFGKLFGKPSYAPAIAFSSQYNRALEQFLEHHHDKGDRDVLIIHKTLGLLTLQISSVGGDFSLKMTKKKKDDKVIKKLEQAIKFLNEAEDVLKHLTLSKVAISKVLVLPNISSRQLLRAINRKSASKHGKDLCKCLGTQSVADAVKLCLLSDQLSDSQTPSDINHSSLQALREWWQRIRESRSGSFLTSSLYEQLVASFCGPATTVEVHCVTAPRLNIRTLGEAVSETGERVARLVLFPRQVDILNQSPPRAFLSGPPGTGKTIVLIMQGLTWIQLGYDVHVVSTCYKSRAVTFVIEYQLQETAKTSTTGSRVHRHQFDLKEDGQVETAVSCLKSLGEGRQLCVIADEAEHDVGESFKNFCDQLINEVPGMYIWGASVDHKIRPLRLEEFKLTTPLRSPPVVVREVMKSWEIQDKHIDDYTVSDVPVPTDGPPIMRIKHRDGHSGHTEIMPLCCVECGHEVARVLTELNVGRTGDSNGPPPLQYRDVLVVSYGYPTEDLMDSKGQVIKTVSGLVRGLRDRHVPVRVVKFGDEADIRDMALGVSDKVTVAFWNDVQGLERKVVVLESEFDTYERFFAMSRCTSQLVVIDRGPV